MPITELRMQCPPAVFDVRQDAWRWHSPLCPDSPKSMREDRIPAIPLFPLKKSRNSPYTSRVALSMPIPGPIVVDNVTFLM